MLSKSSPKGMAVQGAWAVALVDVKVDPCRSDLRVTVTGNPERTDYFPVPVSEGPFLGSVT